MSFSNNVLRFTGMEFMYLDLASLTYVPKVCLYTSLSIMTPAEGASTAIYAAAASELKGIGGLSPYNGRKMEPSALSYDERLHSKMWKESCALVGLQQN
ncbi:dehydrogenase/reductase SDR family member on chromosome X-like [Carassius carassius]|uniref:dehydrogenase/reductase SDR family member on chromosome X-like n=1 Tax=Carassius carassius TaxID=217509 RepID=UPI0028694628|nr:dehydrogenase/reductase SDR family member on chromosome X-like [Carassius carassius]